MKTLWCWRCQMEVPMFDESEYAIVDELYGSAFKDKTKVVSINERFKPLLDWHKKQTGLEFHPNTIMHHRISMYGPPCEKCNNPYQTPKASFCAACGNKRNL